MSMITSSIATYVGGANFERARGVLAQAFGNGGTAIADDAVAALVEGEWAQRAAGGQGSALDFLPSPPPDWQPASLASAQGIDYFHGIAKHERSPNELPATAFNGLLPMARVALPAAPTSLIATTRLGYVFGGDHLLPTTAAVRARMVQSYGAAFQDVSRVDLVTPCRLAGRFGAIAVYLGYRGNGAKPAFYILEAGMATGAPVCLFPSPDFSAIRKNPTGYFPTPFVEPSNTYDGWLTMAANGVDPDTLVVQSFREPRGADGWRIQVTVRYTPVAANDVNTTLPGALTLIAAERIAAIAAALGEPMLDLQDVLAQAARGLDWIQPPRAG